MNPRECKTHIKMIPSKMQFKNIKIYPTKARPATAKIVSI